VRLTQPGDSRVIAADTEEQIGHLLRRMGVSLRPDDRVYPRRWGEVFEGLEIRLVRVDVRDVEETVTVPFPIVLRDDASLQAGTVRLAGTDPASGTTQRLVRVYERSDGIAERVLQAETVMLPTRPRVYLVGAAGRNPLPERLRGERVMSASAYSPDEPGLGYDTSVGVRAGRGVVAVDPSVIPYGTQMWIEGYGFGVAADCGSAIQGNRIDLCFDNVGEVDGYGLRDVRVRFLK
jgi:3D (Asp-Asp-Asp) domain-containing protein